MRNAFENLFYTDWYLEDLKWLKMDIEFYLNLKKPEVKQMYKKHIEWQVSQLKKIKNKIYG